MTGSAGESPDPRHRSIEGRAAVDKLLEVYLNGFTSGAASVLATFVPNAPMEQRDAIVDDMVNGVRADPLAMEVLVNEIGETLTGNDSGPKNFHSGYLGDHP